MFLRKCFRKMSFAAGQIVKSVIFFIYLFNKEFHQLAKLNAPLPFPKKLFRYTLAYVVYNV